MVFVFPAGARGGNVDVGVGVDWDCAAGNGSAREAIVVALRMQFRLLSYPRAFVVWK